MKSFYVGPLTCPEPSTYALGTLGFALLCVLRRKPRP